MELVEVLNENGSKTKKVISKEEAHFNGICHGISAVVLINDNGEVLLAKRAINKKT